MKKKHSSILAGEVAWRNEYQTDSVGRLVQWLKLPVYTGSPGLFYPICAQM